MVYMHDDIKVGFIWLMFIPMDMLSVGCMDGPFYEYHTLTLEMFQ